MPYHKVGIMLQFLGFDAMYEVCCGRISLFPEDNAVFIFRVKI
jgi:hypothetical protein